MAPRILPRRFGRSARGDGSRGACAPPPNASPEIRRITGLALRFCHDDLPTTPHHSRAMTSVSAPPAATPRPTTLRCQRPIAALRRTCNAPLTAEPGPLGIPRYVCERCTWLLSGRCYDCGAECTGRAVRCVQCRGRQQRARRYRYDQRIDQQPARRQRHTATRLRRSLVRAALRVASRLRVREVLRDVQVVA